MANSPIPSPPQADAVATVPSLRTLGTGAQQAASGADARFTHGDEYAVSSIISSGR